MAFRKIEAGLVHAPVDEFIGKTGTIFYDNDLGDFRISDGVTPGGIALSFGGGGGANYTLPTASTTTKGGVKIDGTTIAISNQVISVVNGVFTTGSYSNPSWISSLAYSKLTGAPAVPSNTNELTNGAGFITSSALSGYATESYVTSRGYITSVAWNDITSKPTFATVATSGSYADLTNKPTLFSGSYNDLTNKPTLFSGNYSDLTNKPTIPTNTNELTNGAGYITSAALSGYALTSSIPTDISDLTDTQGLLGQGGGGGGTTVITNNIENPYSFSVAGDDSTLREISNGETLRFAGAAGVTVTSDAEGKITITGPSLVGLATESYVTSQGYITSSALTSYALTTDIPTDNNELTNGAGYITSSALTGLATESYVTSRGYITGLSWNDLTDKPNLAGTYSWSIAADDSTLREISAGESVKIIGSQGVSTSSDAEGNITITGPNLSSYALTSAIPTDNNQLTNGAGYITASSLTGLATESYVTTRGYLTTVSWNDLTDKPNLAGTYSWSIAADDSTQIEISAGNLVKVVGAQGITTTSNADGQITITGPDLTSYATQSYVNSALSNAGVIVSATAPVGQAEGKLWYNSTDLELYVRYDNHWVAAAASFSGNYNDLTNKPTNVSQFTNDAGYVTMDQVYAAILELGSTN